MQNNIAERSIHIGKSAARAEERYIPLSNAFTAMPPAPAKCIQVEAGRLHHIHQGDGRTDETRRHILAHTMNITLTCLQRRANSFKQR